MIKKSVRIDYGNRAAGQSWFDDQDSIRTVKGPRNGKKSGDDYLSLFFAGVNSVVSPDGKSSNSPAHKKLIAKHMSDISEIVSNSLSKDPLILRLYLVRYAKAMEQYKKKHGKYPKQRIIGHSRGGGGALEFMEALADRYPELPRVDEYIGLDPYDLPFASRKHTRRKDKRYVARKSVVVRPVNAGVFDTDASDMDDDGTLGFHDQLYPHFSNLITQPAPRVNPFSRNTSVGIAIPGVHHSSAPEMLDAGLAVSRARSRQQIKDILRAMYGGQALIESRNSPLYGAHGSPIYEKTACSNRAKTIKQKVLRCLNSTKKPSTR